MLQLILGGARSGKSRLAEQTAKESGLSVVYIATAQALDDQENQLILVDCLTLWLTNLLLAEDTALQQQQTEKLLKVLPQLKSDIILVSNETGLGVVPMGEISRRFVDEAGRLHQALGQLADKVVFCVAGFPMILKGEK